MKKQFFAALAIVTITISLAFAGAGHGNSDQTPFGKAGDPKKPARVVQVMLRDADGAMMFEPNRVEVKKGEQIRFVIKNIGEMDHEFVLDTIEGNRKHAIEMQKNPDMEHDDPNSKRLTPKTNAEILWHFTKAGEFQYACLIPGHLEAGMKGTIIVK